MLYRSISFLIAFVCISMQAQYFRGYDVNDGLPSRTIKCFQQDNHGYIWLGTFNGLCRFDGFQFQRYHHIEGDSNTLSSSHIESLLSISDGLLVGTAHGLDWFDLKTGISTCCKSCERNQEYKFIDDFIVTILRAGTQVFVLSSSGNAWVADISEGQNLSHSFRPFDVGSRVLGIAKYTSSLLFVLTRNSLLLYDLHSLHPLYSLPVTGFPDNWNTMYYSKQMNALLIGSGLGYPTRAFIVRGKALEEKPCVLPADVKSILDYGGETYFATDGHGLCTMHDAFTPLNSALTDFAVHSLYVDDASNLWLGTYRGGFCLSSPRFGAIRRYDMSSGDLSYNKVSCLYACGNRIYVGLDGGGLNILDTSKGITEVLTSKNSGLPGDNVLSMACEGDWLWLGIYEHGLCRYSMKNGTFHPINLNALHVSYQMDTLWDLWNDGKGHIVVKDQQTSNVFDGLTGELVGVAATGENPMNPLLAKYKRVPEFRDEEILCAYEDDRGLSYVGTTKSLFVFQRDSLPAEEGLTDSVQIDALSVMNDSVDVRIGSSHPTPIRLHSEQNYVTIHFSQPLYTSAKSARFRYCLDGLDPKWHELEGARSVSYSALPPGRYTFRISRVLDNSSDSFGPETILYLHVLPPWYQTWLARLLFCVFGLCLLWIVLRAYRSRLRMEQAAHLQQERLDFLASITHELRTPMFLITAPLEELLGQSGTPLRVPRSYLTGMMHNAQRLNDLINHILDVRKSDIAPLQLEQKQVDVVELCRRLSGDYERLCAQKDIHFEFEPSCENLKILLDAGKFELILSNLVSNAFKYTGRGGNVWLRVLYGDDLTVSVSDNGIGIPKEDFPHLFEPGFRSAPMAGVQGNGLGLAFVHQLTEVLGGTMTVESEEGKGSTFSLHLPLDGASVSDEASQQVNTECRKEPEKSATPLLPTAARTILVIDDEQDTLELLTRVLGREYRILTARDGKQGLETTARELPDLIICDVMMPTMDGFEFLARVKEDKKLQHIPVMMFSAKDMDEDQIAAYRHGADAYLTKPISIALLRTRVQQFMQRSEATLHASLHMDDKAVKGAVSKEDEQFLLRCREIIDSNLCNPELNVGFLASSLGMSHSALYKRVKAITDHSVVDLVVDYRIFRAVEMMRSGHTNVTSIAESVGFNDVRSFRAAFKSRMGVAPKQFMQSL